MNVPRPDDLQVPLHRSSFTEYGATHRPIEGTRDELVALAKRVIRAGAIGTAPLRVKPDFLIIGAKRGGSTSLYNYVLDHPQVQPLVPRRQRLKGLYFFDVNYAKGERWYRSHFPTTTTVAALSKRSGKLTVTGESTPYYLYHPHAARRAAESVPDAKIIALLRNPIDRAYSHYKERLRQRVETESFADAVQLEPLRLRGELDRMLADEHYRSLPHQMQSYVDQGRYLDGLKRWQAHYGPDQLMVLRSEDLYEEPAKAVRLVQEFLGLEPVAAMSYRAWNQHQAAEVEPELRAHLADLLRSDIAELEEHLCRPLNWS